MVKMIKFGASNLSRASRANEDLYKDISSVYITEENTIQREIELMAIEAKKEFSLVGNAYPFRIFVEDWRQNPIECIADSIPTVFNMYLGGVWCELPKAKWSSRAILSIDEWEIWRDCEEYFSRGFTLRGKDAPIEDGLTLEQIWFLNTFQHQSELLCIINEVMPWVPSERIEHKIKTNSKELIDILNNLCIYKNDGESMRHSLDWIPYFYFYDLITSSVKLGIKPFPERPSYGKIKMVEETPFIVSAFPTLIYDGNIAHAIEVYGFDLENENVVFFDPWPERTLLRAARKWHINEAYNHQRRFWEISSNDLGKLLFAILIPIGLL